MNSTSRRRVAKFVATQLINGESSSRVAKVLAAYLVSNREKRQIELVIRDIESELLKSHSYLSANVSSAHKLTSEARESLIEMLKNETGAEMVELSEELDESLIGGVIVRTPEAEMDSSVKSKLTRLKAI